MALVEGDPKLAENQSGDAVFDAYGEFFEALDKGGVSSELLGFEGVTDPEPVQRAARPRTDPGGEQFGFIDVPPKFTTSDVNRLMTMPVAERTRLKRRMIEGGIIDAKTTTGASTVDPEFLTRYQELLTFMNLNGFRDEFDAIDVIRRAPETLPEGSLPEDPLPAPEAMRAAVEHAAISKIGRKLDPEETQAIVDAWSDVRVRRIQSNVQPPPLDVFAEEQVAAQNPEEAGTIEFAERVNDFYRMLAGPVPSPTPQSGRF